MALDQPFDAGTLHELRSAVQAKAIAAGMSADRAAQVVLAMHELAANAVCHGGGAGRARMRVVGGQLHCQVNDAGPGSSGPRQEGMAPAAAWPFQCGHGLWLVQSVADRVSVAPSLAGSQVIAVFALPPSQPDRAGR